jgi:sulfate adenylyltransferase large subunit
VLVQSRRHTYIASLLRVRHLIVAVNKMDLIAYDESRFRAIEREFSQVLEQIAANTGNPAEARFIPVSALAGENVVHRSQAMQWYQGPSLLELLEDVPAGTDSADEAFRFPVQRVLRPDHTFRGFAGQIASGTVRVGDEIVVLPSQHRARIARIVTWDGDLPEASAPLSVTLVIDREIDISRGDLIASNGSAPEVTRQVQAALVWMDQGELKLRRRYLLKHGSSVTPVHISSIAHRVDVSTLDHAPATTLAMNEIGVVTVDLLRATALEPYGRHRCGGAFILIDPASNGTVAAGMVRSVSADTADDEGLFDELQSPVTPRERAARWGHEGGVVELSGPAHLIDAVERSLFSSGAVTQRVVNDGAQFGGDARLLELLVEAQVQAGILVLRIGAPEEDTLLARAAGREVRYDAGNAAGAAAAVLALLREAGILYETEGMGL